MDVDEILKRYAAGEKSFQGVNLQEAELTNLNLRGVSVRSQQFMQNLQDEICTALEQLDGEARFQQDYWERAEGGEGRTRVIREGRVFEQGGVNFSAIWGNSLPPAILAQRQLKIVRRC